MSNLQYTVSIKNNTNRIISSSEEKFIGIRDGSLIRIDNDSTLYTITGRDNYFFIKNFTVSNPRTITIDENIGMNLQTGDILNISFKEFELLSILEIIDGGVNYQNEEEITIKGGGLNIDISSGIGNPSVLEIKEVDANGKIKIVGIKNKGKYIIPPTNPVEVISNDGNNAKFELKYQESADREILERTIQSIYFQDGKTIISLNYSLPLNLTNGKLSVEKHYLEITPNYIGEDKRNTEYKVFKDATPYLKFPLMSRNSLSQDLIYNKMVQKLDAELKLIKDKLGI